MIIDVYDNLLEPHVAEMIDMEMKEVTWKYDYNSHKDGINKHWHRFCGHETIEEPYSFINHIWDRFSSMDNDYFELLCAFRISFACDSSLHMARLRATTPSKGFR